MRHPSPGLARRAVRREARHADVTIADIIGDLDPIKARLRGHLLR